jgi:hypothetical protein
LSRLDQFADSSDPSEADAVTALARSQAMSQRNMCLACRSYPMAAIFPESMNPEGTSSNILTLFSDGIAIKPELFRLSKVWLVLERSEKLGHLSRSQLLERREAEHALSLGNLSYSRKREFMRRASSKA